MTKKILAQQQQQPTNHNKIMNYTPLIRQMKPETNVKFIKHRTFIIYFDFD